MCDKKYDSDEVTLKSDKEGDFFWKSKFLQSFKINEISFNICGVTFSLYFLFHPKPLNYELFEGISKVKFKEFCIFNKQRIKGFSLMRLVLNCFI